jgi:hypothetical protein
MAPARMRDMRFEPAPLPGGSSSIIKTAFPKSDMRLTLPLIEVGWKTPRCLPRRLE